MEYQQTFCIHKLLCYHTEKVMCGLWSLHHIFERKYLEAYLLVGKIIDVSMYHPHDIHVFTIYLKKKNIRWSLFIGWENYRCLNVSSTWQGCHPHTGASNSFRFYSPHPSPSYLFSPATIYFNKLKFHSFHGAFLSAVFIQIPVWYMDIGQLLDILRLWRNHPPTYPILFWFSCTAFSNKFAMRLSGPMYMLRVSDPKWKMYHLWHSTAMHWNTWHKIAVDTAHPTR